MKKIIAVLLTFALLTVSFAAVNAADEPVTDIPESTTVVSTETTQESEADVPSESVTEETTQAEQDAQPSEDDAAAEMSICMLEGGFPAYFHVWIYIHNISDEALMVGPYELPAGEGVSIGSWGMSVLDGWGIYYNIESHASRNRDAGDYCVLTKQITRQDVEKVSEEVAKWNYWDFIFNCTVFACRVWNCVDGDWIMPIPLPWFIILQLEILGAETGRLEMFVPEEERVYKQIGWADEATLEKVEERSIDSFGASFEG